MIWREALAEATRALSGTAERPEIEARWIVEQASGHEGAALGDSLDDAVTQRLLAYFDAMVARRVNGEPIQYVLGRWPFRTLDLAVDRRVLIPRPETEVVAGHAVAALAGHPGPRVADLGTGSGAIALSVAVECPDATVWATDLSLDALAVARANLAGLGRPATRVSLHHGPWFDALPPALRGSLDVVVSNPPYIGAHEPLPPSVREWEPLDALVSGDSGLDAIEHLVDGARKWLVPGGLLILEIGWQQGAAAVERADRAGYTDRRVEPDLAGLDRVLIARSS